VKHDPPPRRTFAARTVTRLVLLALVAGVLLAAALHPRW